MTESSLSEFAKARSLSAEGVVALAKQVGARPTAAARAAQRDNRIYVDVFGPHAAAHDVPVRRPASLPHAATQAELDALYEAIWPERGTTR